MVFFLHLNIVDCKQMIIFKLLNNKINSNVPSIINLIKIKFLFIFTFFVIFNRRVQLCFINSATYIWLATWKVFWPFCGHFVHHVFYKVLRNTDIHNKHFHIESILMNRYLTKEYRYSLWLWVFLSHVFRYTCRSTHSFDRKKYHLGQSIVFLQVI